MSLRYGYITNGLADHRLNEALELLASHGYAGVGLTLDHHHLDPFEKDLPQHLQNLKKKLQELNLSVVIETGGRFVLDPSRKHFPNLLSEGRERRVDFLKHAVRIAAELEAEAVSFWSGIKPDGMPDDLAWALLVDGCFHVLNTAKAEGVTIGFEPEPGMLLQYIDEWERLANALGNADNFGITLDIGHCHCIEDVSIADCIKRVGERLVQVQIEDMKRGVHEHLNFGDGTVDFPPALHALSEIGYKGLVCVELSRHSHTAHTVVPSAIEFLKSKEQQ